MNETVDVSFTVVPVLDGSGQPLVEMTSQLLKFFPFRAGRNVIKIVRERLTYDIAWMYDTEEDQKLIHIGETSAFVEPGGNVTVHMKIAIPYSAIFIISGACGGAFSLPIQFTVCNDVMMMCDDDM